MFTAYGATSEFAGAAQRELALYAGASGPLLGCMPVYFGAIEVRGTPVLLLERVRDAALIAPSTGSWRFTTCRSAI
ncbi:MAG: hypothetical protein ACREUX_05830 [Burkholderiales bacterium]